MRQSKIAIVVVVILGLGVLAYVGGRTALKSRSSTPRVASPTFVQNRGGAEKSYKRARNLSLQPEAFNMGLRLGSRFMSDGKHVSIVMGTVTIGFEHHAVQLKRLQTDDGEQIDIKLTGGPDTFTWDASQGSMSSGRRAGAKDRELIENLVLDSPDQFVLAQLRGATYDIVARNVRPVDAGDNYSGSLWNVVRVGEPEADDSKRPQSRWRLYYINTKTGLIDRIESEDNQGEKTTAQISWSKVNAEQVPSEIVWTRQGQTLMSYRLSNFSHAVQ